MDSAIRLYLDENVPVVVAEQLQRRGIDVVTARDLEALGDSDISHLARAVQMGCVFCTYDSDFLIMAAEGIEHCGIVYGQGDKDYIGEWVKGLELLCAIYTAEEMLNRVEYLP